MNIKPNFQRLFGVVDRNLLYGLLLLGIISKDLQLACDRDSRTFLYTSFDSTAVRTSASFKSFLSKKMIDRWMQDRFGVVGVLRVDQFTYEPVESDFRLHVLIRELESNFLGVAIEQSSKLCHALPRQYGARSSWRPSSAASLSPGAGHWSQRSEVDPLQTRTTCR